MEWEGWYRVDGQWCINVALGFAKNVHLRWPKKRGRRLLHEQSLQFHLPNHNGKKLFLKKYSYFHGFQNTGGSQIVRILCSQGIVLLQKSYWFSTKITIYDFWIFKVPFFSSFSLIKVPFSQINPEFINFSSYLLDIRTIRPKLTSF